MKLCSLNARGLGNRIKCKSVFGKLRAKADVVLVQETHLDSADKEKLWQTEWGGKMYASFGESNARGVAILISPRAKNIKLEEVQMDNAGQLVCRLLKFEEKTYVLCNVYGPNNDYPTFYEEMIRKLDSYHADSVIVGGDFNLVMNPCMDRNSSIRNHNRAHTILNKFMNKMNLNDVW